MPARPRKAAVAAAKKPDFLALLADAQMPERTINVCLRADLAAEHESADRALKVLLDKPNPKLGDDGRGALRARLLELEEQMMAASYPFQLRAMSHPEWRKFRALHPPRQREDGTLEPRDAAINVNTETIFEPLLRVSLIDPVLTDEQFQEMLGKLTDRQFDDLSWAAWLLNRGEISIPFSPAASRATESSEPE